MISNRISTFSLRRNEIEYDNHIKQLESITKEKRNAAPNDHLPLEISRMRAHRLKFQLNEKLLNIDKDNQILLDRLIEISRKKNFTLKNSKSEAELPKRLHSTYRRKRLEQITQENQFLAKRILTQQPVLNSKHLEKEFQKHQEFLRHCAKPLISPKSKVRLPPLVREDFVKRIHKSNSVDSFSREQKSIIRETQEPKEDKEAKESKEVKEEKEYKEVKVEKESKDIKQVKESKEPKETKESKISNDKKGRRYIKDKKPTQKSENEKNEEKKQGESNKEVKQEETKQNVQEKETGTKEQKQSGNVEAETKEQKQSVNVVVELKEQKPQNNGGVDNKDQKQSVNVPVEIKEQKPQANTGVQNKDQNQQVNGGVQTKDQQKAQVGGKA